MNPLLQSMFISLMGTNVPANQRAAASIVPGNQMKKPFSAGFGLNTDLLVALSLSQLFQGAGSKATQPSLGNLNFPSVQQNKGSDFITQAYRQLLGRDPDSKGLGDWSRLYEQTPNNNLIDLGVTDYQKKASVLEGILLSPEYRGLLQSSEERFASVYLLVHGKRAPETARGTFLQGGSNYRANDADLYPTFAATNLALGD